MRSISGSIVLLAITLILISGCSSQLPAEDQAEPTATMAQNAISPTPETRLSYEDIQTALKQIRAEAGYTGTITNLEAFSASEDLQTHLDDYVKSSKGAKVENWRGSFIVYTRIKSPPEVLNGFEVAVRMEQPPANPGRDEGVFLYFEGYDDQQKQALDQLQPDQSIEFSGVIGYVSKLYGIVSIMQPSISSDK